MHKSQRLFKIVTLLRGRRTAITAQALAEALEVTKRTVYRDIDELVANGLPIQGAAGVGYLLNKNAELPPLMFDAEEMQALLLGAEITTVWSDDELAAGAERAAQKIKAVLPDKLLHKADKLPWLVPKYTPENHNKHNYQQIRIAYENSQKVAIHYKDLKENQTKRIVWPLAMLFWGGTWTLLSWCQKRDQYRSFRIDRIIEIEILEETYQQTSTCSLQHYTDTYVKPHLDKYE